MANAQMSVSDFYAGKSVFLTGGTGFIGKIYIEKLLRCCPDIKHLYLLLRSKKDKTPQQRINHLLSDRVFNKIKSERPGAIDKLRVIAGDLEVPALGISPADLAEIRNNVNVIVHSAATVRFDEVLPLAISLNLRAVADMLAIADSCHHLEVFVHISTAYSNCDHKSIDEVIYPVKFDPEKMIDLAKWMPEHIMEAMTPALIEPKPNTYTFTKHLAENMVYSHINKMKPRYRMTIVRPSIVGAVWKEPLPGWVDNFNGPCGVYVSAGKGILRKFICAPDTVADIIPVDVCANLSIAVGWYTMVKQEDPLDVIIYNCTADIAEGVTWSRMADFVMDFWHRTPLESCFRRPWCSIASTHLEYRYWSIVSHIIPAHLTDTFFRLVGKKPRMVRIYDQIEKMVSALALFSTNKWSWQRENYRAVQSAMSPEDRAVFYVDPAGMDWEKYIQSYCLGAKQYLLKEDVAKVSQAHAHLRNLRNIRYVSNAIMIALFWRFVVAKSQFGRNVWSLVLQFVSKFLRFFSISMPKSIAIKTS